MAFQGDSIFWVEVEKIVPNPFQPRREFNQEKLQELADSIRMYGVLQPLTVTRKEVHREDGTFYTEYELIAGERRLRASKLAKVEQVPVIIRSGEQTEQEKLELAIIENLQREDLNAVDRALAFKQLAEAFDLSITQVAKKVGRSREYVSNSIRLLGLPDHILDSVKTGDITEGHGRTLLMLKERPEELEVVYKEILLKKLSVREVERIARKIASDKVRKKKWADTDAHLIEMERDFTDTLGTRVQISKTDFGGKLTIDYFTEAELEKLLHVIKSQRTLLESANDETTTAPVIQELVQAESTLAAIAQATPLQAVEAEEQNEEAPSVEEAMPAPEQKPEPESQSEPTPAQPREDTAEPTPEAAPEPAVTETQQPAAPAYNAATPASPQPEANPEPAANPTESYQPAKTEETSPAQAPADVQPPAASETERAHQQTYEPSAAAPEAPEYRAQPTPAPAAESETVSTHTALAPTPTPTPSKKPQVVATFNDKKSFILRAPDTHTVSQPAAAPTQPTPAPNPETSQPPTKPSIDVDDSDDLYSINRFSI